MLKRLFNLVLVMVLAVVVTACGGGSGPSQAVIGRAIAMTVETSQQGLAQQLRLARPEAKALGISRVQVERSEAEQIDGDRAYHLQGRYALSYPQSDRQVTQENLPFDLYLKPQQLGKEVRWQLAMETGNSDRPWKLKPVPRG